MISNYKSGAFKWHKIVTFGLLVTVLVITGVLYKGLKLDPQAIQSPLVGKKAPSIDVRSLQSIEGQAENLGPTRLENFVGKKVILNFWASWCVSCREEAAYFEAFWKAHQSSDVIVLGIAIQDTPETALDFAKSFGKTYPLALDETGKASLDYGVTGVPETFFIDKEGVVRHRETGPITSAMLERQLKLLQ